MKQIQDMRRHTSETLFHAAVQHLFDNGHQNFDEEHVAEAKDKIKKTTKPNSILTADFQCELLDCCLALSKLPVWDVLLYVKLYMNMDGCDMLIHEEAERALRTRRTEFEPQAWRDAYDDPELRSEMVQELVDRHTDHFSNEEIKAAVRSVVDSHNEV